VKLEVFLGIETSSALTAVAVGRWSTRTRCQAFRPGYHLRQKRHIFVQSLSEKSRTPKCCERVFQIGLRGVVEADLNLFGNSWSAGVLREQLYRERVSVGPGCQARSGRGARCPCTFVHIRQRCRLQKPQRTQNEEAEGVAAVVVGEKIRRSIGASPPGDIKTIAASFSVHAFRWRTSTSRRTGLQCYGILISFMYGVGSNFSTIRPMPTHGRDARRS